MSREPSGVYDGLRVKSGDVITPPMADQVVCVADEVRDALQTNAGVVALESTIIAHGLPFPENLQVARALEAAVRERGAVPATIAIIDGVSTIGLDSAELEHLARTGTGVAKTSAVDMSLYMARGHSAATTVSATAALASQVGIRVFATGGIGGVHRGDSGDVSNDLIALSRTPIAVVSAGAKAILDLPRTLEMLETLGVLVVGYQTDEFPAFYTRESGLSLEHRVDSANALAKLLHVRFEQFGQGGVLIANPIPAPHAMDAATIDQVIDRAIAYAHRKEIIGKALTPFLLAEIAEATQGASVQANRALAVSNARLAADVASAYALARHAS